MTSTASTGMAFAFEAGATTHAGRVRQANEDAHAAMPEYGVWVVADGMGGHAGGQLASRTVTAECANVGLASSLADLGSRLGGCLTVASGKIRQIAKSQGRAIIGSTVVALLIHDGRYSCVWAGDSRVYLLRDGIFTQVSRDHSEVQELVDAGVITPEQARTWPRRNAITRAVGVGDELRLDEVGGDLRADDIFLLCSDGLTTHLTDGEITALLHGMPPQQACDALVEAALEKGGSDNVTVMTVRCQAVGPPRTAATTVV